MRLIDADKLPITNTYALANSKANKITFAPLACVLKSDIDNAPTVEATPKGKWITVNLQQENDGGAFMCSCCKERSWDYGNSYHFCPNCGARMER